MALSFVKLFLGTLLFVNFKTYSQDYKVDTVFFANYSKDGKFLQDKLVHELGYYALDINLISDNEKGDSIIIDYRVFDVREYNEGKRLNQDNQTYNIYSLKEKTCRNKVWFEILSKKISVGKIGSINQLCFLKSDIIFIAIESENYEIRIFKIVKTR